MLARPASEDELTRFCREKLAEFKVPRRIHCMDAIPRAATGKIQRRSLTELFSK